MHNLLPAGPAIVAQQGRGIGSWYGFRLEYPLAIGNINELKFIEGPSVVPVELILIRVIVNYWGWRCGCYLLDRHQADNRGIAVATSVDLGKSAVRHTEKK